MQINTIASVLVGLFDAEAAVGLALLALVIVVIVHRLFDARHDAGSQPGDRRLR
jgi:hypothetical protein